MAVRRRDRSHCRDFLFSLAAPNSIQQNTVSFCFGLDFAPPARPMLEGRRIHDRSQLADAAIDRITCWSWNRGARVVRNAAGVNTLVWKRTQPERAQSIDRLLVVGVALSWVMAALGEELFYRGYLMNRVAGVLGGSKTAWTVSFIFMLALFGLHHFSQGVTGV